MTLRHQLHVLRRKSPKRPSNFDPLVLPAFYRAPRTLNGVKPESLANLLWARENSSSLASILVKPRAGKYMGTGSGAHSIVKSELEVLIHFVAEKYAPKYDKAVECLIKDRETLLTFFDFPADHWDHLRTTNPIESVFATVRHRTVRMKGALSQATARLMVFKLVMAAAKTWRRLQGQNQLPKVIKGVKFRDGIEVAPETKSAA